MPMTTSPVMAADAIRHALAIADRAVVSDIETCAQRAASPWWDVRPMLDEREHSPPIIDMATQALAYARLRGLIVQHIDHPHLVRLCAQPQP